MQVDLHIGECRSLKAKRAVLKPIIEGAKRRFGVACAEVAGENTWQRASIGVAIVSNSVHHAEDVIDEVERFIWSMPEVQVLRADRHWLEHES